MGDIETAKGCANDIFKATWGTSLQAEGQEMTNAIHERIELLAA